MEFDINMITTLIGNIGFPIVCCLYMMTSNTKIVKANTEAVIELREVIQSLVNKVE